MDNFIVSARKYRPDTFDSVVGQKALTTTLKNSVKSGRLGHAYLFCGPRGVGKTTCARIFAKSINCFTPTPEGNPCNECESCRAFNEQRSLNIHELDAASNNGIEDIRAIVEQVRIPPQIGRYKVFIVDEVHMLSSAAFNGFLKTLEEPPEHVVFVLATTEKYKLLPTIISRCQIFDFSRIEISDIVDHLSYVARSEGVEAETEALGVIARKADGGMRDALSMFDQIVSFTDGHLTYARVIENLNVLDYEYYFRLTDALLVGDVSSSLLLFNEILAKGFDGAHFIGGLASHFRNLLVSRDEATLVLLEVAGDVRTRYAEQARRCEVKFLYNAIKLCNDCDLNYRTSRNKRLLVELTLIRVSQSATEKVETSHPSSVAGNIKPVAPTASKPVAAASPSPTASPPNITAVPPKATSILSPANEVQKEVKAPAETSAKPRTTGLKITPMMGVTGSKETSVSSSSAPPILESEASVYGNKPLAKEELDNAWFKYALQLPKEESMMSNRMKNAMPRIIGERAFEVTAENPMVKELFEKLRIDILPFLKRELSNNSIEMTITEMDASSLKQKSESSTPEGLYRQMLKNSSPLRRLSEGLGLELS